MRLSARSFFDEWMGYSFGVVLVRGSVGVEVVDYARGKGQVGVMRSENGIVQCLDKRRGVCTRRKMGEIQLVTHELKYIALLF